MLGGDDRRIGSPRWVLTQRPFVIGCACLDEGIRLCKVFLARTTAEEIAEAATLIGFVVMDAILLVMLRGKTWCGACRDHIRGQAAWVLLKLCLLMAMKICIGKDSDWIMLHLGWHALVAGVDLLGSRLLFWAIIVLAIHLLGRRNMTIGK